SILAQQSAGLGDIIIQRCQQLSTVKDILTNICRYEDRNIAGQFAAVLLWVLCNNINNSVWNNMKETRQSLGAKAVSIWQERINSFSSRQISDRNRQKGGTNVMLTPGSMRVLV
ncbi:hypothetical protein L195_g030509, partial [Trifolium pratense]